MSWAQPVGPSGQGRKRVSLTLVRGAAGLTPKSSSEGSVSSGVEDWSTQAPKQQVPLAGADGKIQRQLGVGHKSTRKHEGKAQRETKGLERQWALGSDTSWLSHESITSQLLSTGITSHLLSTGITSQLLSTDITSQLLSTGKTSNLPRPQLQHLHYLKTRASLMQCLWAGVARCTCYQAWQTASRVIR